MNVIILTIDALRKETLACYNLIDGISTGFEELYNNGVVFHNFFTVIPETYQGLGSLFTGLYPFKHKIACEPYDTNIPTMFDYLLDTHKPFIFTTEQPFGESLTYEQYKKYNMFDLEASRACLRSTPPVLAPLRNFIKNNKDQDFFFTTHFWTPRKYAVKKDNDFGEYIKAGKLDEVWKASLNLVEEAGAAIKELVSILKEYNVFDKTIIFLTADHGDYFSAEKPTRGFHQLRQGVAGSPGVRHTEIRYNPVINIPGILYHPMLKKNRVTNVTANIDIMPTLLDFLGKEITHPIDGTSLFNLLVNNIELNKRDLFIDRSHTANIYTVIDNDGYKMIYAKNASTANIQLYNIFDDPEEINDLTNVNNEKVGELLGKLNAFPTDIAVKKEDVMFRYRNYKNIEYVKDLFTKLNLDDWMKKAEFFNQVSWVNDKTILQQITDLVNNDDKQNILEVGIGTGRLTNYIKKQKNGNYFGMDSSPAMLSLIENRNELDVKTGDIHDLNYPSNFFDIVLMRGVLHYSKEPNKVFSDIYRVLKPNGRIIFCDEIPQNEEIFQLWYKINMGINWPGRDTGFFKTRVYSMAELQGMLIKNKFKIIGGKYVLLNKQSLDNYTLIYDRTEKRTIKRRYHDTNIEYKKVINFSEDNDIRSGQPYGDVFVNLNFAIINAIKE